MRLDMDSGAVAVPARETERTSAAYRRLVIASAFGTMIEWYDFFAYALIAPLVFDSLFFPKTDPLVSLIAVYATFTIGFMARPIGGILFGHFSDRVGRKSVLMITLLLMGVASTLIGLIPSYARIGVMAPITLVFLRILQGLALGGESVGAVVLTLENAPAKRRGFYASFCNAAGPVGIILSSGLSAYLMSHYGKAAFQSWAWRVPFLLSFVLVLVGTYMRSHVDESFLFTDVLKKKKIPRVPIAVAFKSCKKSMLFAFLVNLVHSSYNYLSTIFLMAYAIKKLSMSQSGVTSGFTIGNVIELVTVLVIAHLSDRFGRKPFLIMGIIASAIYFPILIHLVLLNNVFYFIVAMSFSIGIVHSLMYAPEAAFTAEQFPTEVRVSGASLGKQVGVVLGGGVAPLVATSLMGRGTNFMPVIWYFWAMAILAFVGVLFAKESSKRAL
jgi:MFS family permease